MKTKDLYNSISSELESLYTNQEAKNISFLLLESIFGINQTDIIVNKTLNISEEKEYELKRCLDRLKKHEPIQYVLEKADFYGRVFKVDTNVLIPRSETEELVDLVIKENKIPNLKILDIGTGSGCIPITLKLELSDPTVEAIDINKSALSVAQQNATDLKAQVSFHQLNILNQELRPIHYDIIISNPPYVTQSEKPLMRANVLNYEPHLALFVEDNDPLIFYNTITKHSKNALQKGGQLYFEINENLGVQVAKIMEETGFKNVRVIQDLNGKDRIVTGVLS
ncbi:MAG: peptide chain release factor N(5)-glutamine methyltransferase [Cyclobacteriaceae bacterium]|nr:peptide chain release factor N(5)-glutamine methyltransferase [Cyclobacteriaceae bacterium]